MASYPATCSLGHAAVVLQSDAELQTHITSEHSGGDAATVRKQLTRPQASASSDIPDVTITSPLMRLGIKVEDLHSIKTAELSGAADITPEAFVSFLTSFGKRQTPTINPSLPFFLLDFFIFVLRTGASEETESAGSFTLREKGGSNRVDVSWNTFKVDAVNHFKGSNLPFTMRKLMRCLDSALWEIWSDPKVEALDDIRRQGTALSRRWTFKDGSHPKAYVVVPELFTNHLSPEERKLRISTNDKVRKVKDDGSGDVTYEGYDADQDYLDRHSERKAKLASSSSSLAERMGTREPYVRPWESLRPNHSSHGLGFK